MRSGWVSRNFEACIERIKYPTKIHRKKFLAQGEWPIISQEADFINGYWDNEADLLRLDKPLIVFGDHTKTLKYIDFDFVLGADGVKLLQPIDEINSKYFYYFLCAFSVKSLGYARHYRLLKEIQVWFPQDIPEQKRIVATLDEAFEGIDKVVANTKKNLANARELFDSYLNNIFTQKGDGWKEVKLGEVCKIARGGSPRPIKAFLTDGTDGINWIKISDATASTKYIYETKQKIKPEGVKRSRLVHDGDFLLSNSMSFGHPYIMRTSGCIHDGWLVLSDKSGLFDQDYLYYYLGSPEAYRQFDDRAAGSTVRNLNIDSAKSVDVPLPSLPEQNHIVAKLDVLRVETQRLEAIYQQKLTALTELKQSFLQRAFTGELTAEDKTIKIEAVA